MFYVFIIWEDMNFEDKKSHENQVANDSEQALTSDEFAFKSKTKLEMMATPGEQVSN